MHFMRFVLWQTIKLQYILRSSMDYQRILASDFLQFMCIIVRFESAIWSLEQQVSEDYIGQYRFIYTCLIWDINLKMFDEKCANYNNIFLHLLIFTSFLLITIELGPHFHSKLPASLQSFLPYKFHYTQCVFKYVGSSVRSLHNRVAEHGGRSKEDLRIQNIRGNKEHNICKNFALSS